MHARTRSFQELMQLTLYLQYFCFSIPAYAIRNSKTLVVKKVWNWIELVISCAAILSYALIVMTLTENGSKINVLNILMWVVSCTSAANEVIASWELKTKAELVRSIFENIKVLDENITLENKRLDNLKLKVKIWGAVIILATGVVISFSVFSGRNAIETIFAAFSSIRINVRPMSILVQFFVLNSLVQLYLEWINEQLGKMRQLNVNGKGGCKPYATFRPHFSVVEDCKVASKIEHIRKLYGRVHDLKKDVNEAYTLRLWMDMVNTVLQTLYFVYFNIEMLKNREKLGITLLLSLYFVRFLIFVHMLKFLQIVQICGKVTECCKIIGVKVHEIFSSSYCESVRNELTTFSLEVLHRDPRVRANKIIDVDYSLTASVVRGVIMQLIALLQLNIPNNADENVRPIFASEGANLTSDIPPSEYQPRTTTSV